MSIKPDSLHGDFLVVNGAMPWPRPENEKNNFVRRTRLVARVAGHYNAVIVMLETRTSTPVLTSWIGPFVRKSVRELNTSPFLSASV